MNDEPKITAVEKAQKVKDPKKVEAGKRLAAISRAAKERKAIERESAAKVSDVETTNVIAYSVAVAVVLGAMLYTRYGGSEPETKVTTPEEEKAPVSPTRPKRSLDSFD